MSLVIASYGSSGSVGDVTAFAGCDREFERMRGNEGAWKDKWLSSMCAGSAGVVLLIHGYMPFVPHVGTSTTVSDSRRIVRWAPKATPEAPNGNPVATSRRAASRMSVADQVCEIMAALSLNKTQLAEVLRVTRPTLYEWLDGKEPNAANAKRLLSLLRLLADSGVTAADSLSPRFARGALIESEQSLLDLLKAETLDEARISLTLGEAKASEDEARRTRQIREERLRALGFEEPNTEQRRANLAFNVALREWPKD
jgi:DNA-binding transcriptional regulator YiaG